MKLKRTLRSYLPLVLFVFVTIATFSFLSAKKPQDTLAASLANFKPGNIISDYVMSNYNSMSESEIQNFLKSKNSCNDTRTYLADTYSNYSYHIKNGHFVCLADETFGDGIDYGEDAPNGQSAAHIIWQAAQDYKINPQVLIVLLQKEQSLITDTWPNSRQFRSATGYGCPDTAACNSKYYGFKNQVRNAAALFRTVLNGGWTNYPLGNNYIQYNPNSDCGGSTVYIENLATSSLYRYTPYQPNAGALAAGYGTTSSCGAYGNRNFYLYFSDWFGNPTVKASYTNLETPRYLELRDNTNRINPYTGETVDTLPAGMVRKYNSKIEISSGEWCLRTEASTAANSDACIKWSDLKEVNLNYEPINEEMIIMPGAKKIFMRTSDAVMDFSYYTIRRFTKKVTFLGETYFITEFDSLNNGAEYGIPERFLIESYKSFDAKWYTLKEASDRVDPFTGKVYDRLEKGRLIQFSAEIVTNDKKYYQTTHNNINQINAAIPASSLVETNYEPFNTPREMLLTTDTNRINPVSGEVYDILYKGRVIKFSSKICIDGVLYYRTEHNTINDINAVIPAWTVEEI